MLKSLKKVMAYCILIMMLASLNCNVFAASDLDEYLVNHWDFEGADKDEILTDKATGGTTADNLVLNEYGTITLEDGYAYLTKAGPNIAMYVPDLSDDTELQGPQTLYLRLYLETYDESEWADPRGLSTDKGFQQIFDQRGEGGITMSVIKDDLSNPDTWKFDVKVGDKAGWTNTNPGKDFWTKIYDNWVELVVVIDEGDTGNLKATFYINFEGTAQSIEDFEKFFEYDTKWPTLLVNDITRMGGYVNGGDWAWTTGHIKYVDVRMYNTALSVDQLVQVSKEVKNWEYQPVATTMSTADESSTSTLPNATTARPGANSTAPLSGTSTDPVDDNDTNWTVIVLCIVGAVIIAAALLVVFLVKNNPKHKFK